MLLLSFHEIVCLHILFYHFCFYEFLSRNSPFFCDVLLNFYHLFLNDSGSRCFTVISVRSARQVIDALNAEGPEIDIILAEVNLPMAKGMKMLKYITRDKDLRRIPVISKPVAPPPPSSYH